MDIQGGMTPIRVSLVLLPSISHLAKGVGDHSVCGVGVQRQTGTVLCGLSTGASLYIRTTKGVRHCMSLPFLWAAVIIRRYPGPKDHYLPQSD